MDKKVDKKNTSVLSKIKYLYQTIGTLGIDVRERYYKNLNRQNVDIAKKMLKVQRDLNKFPGNFYEDYMSRMHGVLYDLMMHNESDRRKTKEQNKQYLLIALNMLYWKKTVEGAPYWAKIWDEVNAK